MKINNRLAFTFVEAMLTVLIFTVMLAGVYASLQVGTRAWTNLSSTLITRQEIRRGIITITRDLRQSSNLLIEKNEKDSSIQVNFRTAKDGNISYYWSPRGKNAQKIIRKNYEKVRTIANGIALFEINMPNTREASVLLSTGRGQPVMIKEKVAFRMKTNPFRSVTD